LGKREKPTVEAPKQITKENKDKKHKKARKE